jgi:hypothetical protein
VHPKSICFAVNIRSDGRPGKAQCLSGCLRRHIGARDPQKPAAANRPGNGPGHESATSAENSECRCGASLAYNSALTCFATLTMKSSSWICCENWAPVTCAATNVSTASTSGVHRAVRSTRLLLRTFAAVGENATVIGSTLRPIIDSNVLPVTAIRKAFTRRFRNSASCSSSIPIIVPFVDFAFNAIRLSSIARPS